MDLYKTLRVSRSATQHEIDVAKRCLYAELWTKGESRLLKVDEVKMAHKILSNKDIRAIYDKFGLNAAQRAWKQKIESENRVAENSFQNKKKLPQSERTRNNIVIVKREQREEKDKKRDYKRQEQEERKWEEKQRKYEEEMRQLEKELRQLEEEEQQLEEEERLLEKDERKWVEEERKIKEEMRQFEEEERKWEEEVRKWVEKERKRKQEEERTKCKNKRKRL